MDDQVYLPLDSLDAVVDRLKGHDHEKPLRAGDGVRHALTGK
jgi:hypothetical protein